MNGLPYFAFYASDFLSGVAAMPLEDRGAYITLLCHQWVNGSIPDDLPACVRICGGGTVSERVLDKFQNVDGTETRMNARLEKERVKCVEAREKAKKRKTKWKERGRNANGTRSGTVPDTSRERLGSDSDSLLPLGKRDIQEPEKPKTKRKAKAEILAQYTPDFIAICEAYPNIPSRKDAFAAWQATVNRPSVEEVLEKIKEHKASDQWTKDGGRFIPGLTVWINQRRWEAKMLPAVQSSSQPGGMNAERKFDPVANKALMEYRFNSLPKGPEDES